MERGKLSFHPGRGTASKKGEPLVLHAEKVDEEEEGEPAIPDGFMPDGNMVFSIGLAGEEQKVVMEIAPEGDFFVHGKKVATDSEVYEGFKEWLLHARKVSGLKKLDS